MFADKNRRRLGLLGIAVLFLAAANGTARAETPAMAQAPATLQVNVVPSQANVQLGASTKFTAKVSGPGANAGVEWLVEGVVGGNDAVGRILPSGKYTSPTQSTLPRQIRIAARSKSDPTVTANAIASLALPPPRINIVYPQKIATGWVTLRIEGEYFDSRLKLRLGKLDMITSVNGNAIAGTIEIPVNSPPSLPVFAYDPADPKRKSNVRQISVVRNPTSGLVVYNASVVLRGGGSFEFKARSGGMLVDRLGWYVNGVLWGNSTVGTMTESGFYRAPLEPPSPGTVTITAKTMEPSPKTGRAFVAILEPMPTIMATFPIAMKPGTPTLTIQGRGFISGAKVLINGAEVPTAFLSSQALRATPTLSRPATRRVIVQVVNPPPAGLYSNSVEVSVLSDPATTTYRATPQQSARFLAQSAFGPDLTSLDRVQELGLSGWLDEQFATPESLYPPVPATMQEDFVGRHFARLMLRGQDQLRQRMVFALGQLFVVSGNKLRDQTALLEWQRMLSKNAFGNFRDLLDAVTKSPVMGRYLDLANSEKANSDGSVVPNENYARELMQLFSIGLVELNIDGTPRLDASGNPISTYDQTTVVNLSRALTGWGYPRDPARSFVWPTPVRYIGQMEPFDTVHDPGAKTLTRGYTIPAGGTVAIDTKLALDHIFNHPNTAPFVATRLIRHFVKSNPSNAYVERVSRVFENNGRGVRGDMKAVLRAVLLDDEATNPQLTVSAGKLREPILYITNVLRALQAQPQADFEDHFATTRYLGQKTLESPTVFNFFSPLNRVGTQGLFGPEFEIFTPVMAVARFNTLYRLLNGNYNGDFALLLDVYEILSPNPSSLVDRVNADFFQGQMSTQLRNELIDTVSRQTADPKRRAMSALWLALTSGEYIVQH